MPRLIKITGIILIAIITVAVIRFSAFTGVDTGAILLCKYKHTIRKDVSKTVVPRWNTEDYGVLTTTITCQKHKRLEKLRAQALAALKKGDTATAKKLFEDIKRVDPTFRDVNTQLDRINNNAAAPADPANPANPTPTTPAVDLQAMLPAALIGYKSGEIDAGEGYASRNYRPTDLSRMQSLLVTVHAAGTLDGAEQFIIRVDQAVFAVDAKNTTVNGYNAYFGTDGATYATLAWAKGTIVYEVQAHSSSGDPAGLEQDLLSLAAAFN